MAETAALKRSYRKVVAFTEHWWYLVGPILLVGGIIGAIAAFNIGPDRPGHKELIDLGGEQVIQTVGGGRQTPGWAYPVGALAILVAVIGLFILAQRANRRAVTGEKGRLNIEKMSASLTEALNIIDGINRQVTEGQQTLDRLERETDVRRQLARLSSDEAKAVTLEMQDIVRAETSRGTRYQFLINFGFFVAGVVITLVLTR